MSFTTEITERTHLPRAQVPGEVCVLRGEESVSPLIVMEGSVRKSYCHRA